jgi:hypothetical protein
LARLEFSSDCSSPWSDLAFHRIEQVAAAARAKRTWKPVLVGGVSNPASPSAHAQRVQPVPAKLRCHTEAHISRAAVLEEVAKHAGFEPQEFFARLAEQKLEDRLPPVREALKAAP